ncbi:hypothetical protein K2173_023023 [Erythroxylum novogranatense]|uniref:Dof zinc finger protein n=1 Tax=Erythroxylum novogranatense TaxID=1862640 RepID=A0AAV8T9B4_9ROSI|nr:hypothetical protein K2173_023023 [Erythroxylum novogranatense]
MFAASQQITWQCPPRPLPMERNWNSCVELAPNCPRCASSNTKFCYYNNYSLSQPRYFCKGCRRYWTKGGTLRNVPVGGGCRKNRRAKSTRASYNEPATNNLISGCGTSKHSDQQLGDTYSSKDSVLSDALIDKCQKQVDLIQESECLLPEALVEEQQQQGGEQILQELIESDEVDEFGLQALLGDEMVQDALWSDTANLPNVTWQPLVQMQEFDPFRVEEHLIKTSANFMSDNNWNPPDLSGFEVFSKP